MYFWRIEKLKASMATAQLTEREVLPYLIATMILLTVAFGAMRHMPVTSYWDDIYSILNILFAIIGTIYVYHKNNGATGRNFLQRYIVISWVVGTRWFVGFTIIFAMFLIILPKVNFLSGNAALVDFIFSVVAEITLYWRIGHHVHDLSQRTIPQ